MNAKLVSAGKWEGRFTAALVFEDAKGPLGMPLAEGKRYMAVAAGEDFRGQYKKTILLRSDHGETRLLLAGLGKRKDFAPDRVRVATAKLLKMAETMGVTELGVMVPESKAIRGTPEAFIAAAVEGAVLGSYRYSEHREVKDDESKPVGDLVFVMEPGQKATPAMRRALSDAVVTAEAVCYTRDLVNEPPSQKAPEMMAELATWLGKKGRISIEVIRKDELVKQGMNGILRVGAGSHEPPCLVHMTYRPRRKTKKSICIVGKGVTFDSGGLSLKPATSMDTMKSDMAGAAAVFGLFKLLNDMNVGVTVHGLTPLAENLPGGGAQKPGDVIRMYSGKTVEVLNTDAEGRLILADALAYGCKLKPDLIIDMATLTGAAVVAVGDEYSALLGTAQRVIDRLTALGKEQGEFFWQLPLPARYRSHIKSQVADIKNMGKPRIAGTIAAGLFLQEFVDKDVPWVHMDIAGPSYTKQGWDYAPSGGTGVPLRTLAAFIRSL